MQKENYVREVKRQLSKKDVNCRLRISPFQSFINELNFKRSMAYEVRLLTKK